MLCDKDCVVKDGMWQSCVGKKISQRWSLTKLKDAVQKNVCNGVCVSKMVSDKGVW